MSSLATWFNRAWLCTDRSVPLGEVLAQEPVGVLVRAALPRAVWITEVDLHVGRCREPLVVRELLASVPGQGLVQMVEQLLG